MCALLLLLLSLSLYLSLSFSLSLCSAAANAREQMLLDAGRGKRGGGRGRGGHRPSSRTRTEDRRNEESVSARLRWELPECENLGEGEAGSCNLPWGTGDGACERACERAGGGVSMGEREAASEEKERHEMGGDGAGEIEGYDFEGGEGEGEGEGWGGIYFSHMRMPSPPLIPGVEEELLVFEASEAEGSEQGGWGCGADVGGGEGRNYEEEDMLSLVYDPILMCYYERTSGRYFQLKENLVGGQLYPTFHAE